MDNSSGHGLSPGLEFVSTGFVSFEYSAKIWICKQQSNFVIESRATIAMHVTTRGRHLVRTP